MARTTAELVAGIVEVDAENFPDLTPYITSANELVTEICGAVGYTDARLELIERWLAGHFYAVRDVGALVASETAGPVSETFKYNVGLALMGTRQGQQALVLDTSGLLAQLSAQIAKGAKRTVAAAYLGTKPCEA